MKHFFYRTAAGAELDLVLEHPDGKLWAIEIKSGTTAKVSRGFHQSIDDLKVDRALVVHAGKDSFPITETIEAMDLTVAMNALKSAL
ncbi:MAG: DUF4143 domain-containing protein [Pseudomonadota bacterium]